MPVSDAAAPHGTTRRHPALLWIVAAALLVARVATGLYEERHPPQLPDLMNWVSPADAVPKSHERGRPILYVFSAAWCGPCQVMNREVFANEKHTGALQQLAVPVHLIDRQREDGHNSAVVDSLERTYFVRAFPTLVLADASGKQLHRIEGFPGAEEMLKQLMPVAMQARANSRERNPGVRLVFP